MKRTKTVILLVLIVVVFTVALYYLWLKNQEDPITYTSEAPTEQTIVVKTVATGSIVPKEEILIKPNISGVIEEVFIEAGEYVNQGDLIAQIRVIPNVSNLTSAKNSIASNRTALQTAEINFKTQKAIYDRQKELFDKGVIAANEFDQVNNTYLQAKQSVEQARINVTQARQNYDIIKTGTTSGVGNVAQTQVRATVSGMVLDVPVKAGNQVIEANNFNEGTSIASLADVKKMIFEGKVDESEVGKIKEGLPLEITVGAIEDQKFDAVLDYIAPKGVAENGAIQFAIKGSLKKIDSTFIRAGLSANASIILEKAEQVLAIKEGLVQYDKESKKPFVEIEVGDQKYERKDVELGISDGIFVEVKSGISIEDKIKVWNQVQGIPKYAQQ
ncbi:efflux RND transporter periplasmic adaptor subunit [Psychroserpens sp.]|uniref:efflux RND transporter periplasmic adaptor subunit n=1 Tax=Psychroserpens sp. TaxID=2020870 RepID=UPI001B22D5F4|nr:HlyD family efflux transporter periplasmic adaptor subunit [Psychroserpens sp.]MBO6607851.1 HlyD family efflux transporter periplasmic adaptor subunit [Psychroserpens sp.]MBO6654842.1 HlyD family efflux transporter periplasmic adaptor subunit [Psychroserpens sp.]MBO6682734.1 HlyD family efflux transporter periplasmic adaptor subunit [Psychroserpens sp.]MBO6751209.1 HlyD family efflux transporter periplasmic adaptor subunit [Psychroserpens sp.]MBO6916222.1 HlyD family efflux transporter peri